MRWLGNLQPHLDLRLSARNLLKRSVVSVRNAVLKMATGLNSNLPIEEILVSMEKVEVPGSGLRMCVTIVTPTGCSVSHVTTHTITPTMFRVSTLIRKDTGADEST